MSRKQGASGGRRRRDQAPAGPATVAARIRYAREHAGLEPMALRQGLKARGLTVSKQLLHRYETVDSSNPNLGIVEAIEVQGLGDDVLARPTRSGGDVSPGALLVGHTFTRSFSVSGRRNGPGAGFCVRRSLPR